VGTYLLDRALFFRESASRPRSFVGKPQRDEARARMLEHGFGESAEGDEAEAVTRVPLA
jgi:hypothetical protein